MSDLTDGARELDEMLDRFVEQFGGDPRTDLLCNHVLVMRYLLDMLMHPMT